MVSVVQIAPSFAPRIDGVGDYARLLGDHLQGLGIESRVVVGDPAWSNSGKRTGTLVRSVKSRTTESFIVELGCTKAVVLHYVGYGYHPTGVPRWLEVGLRKWKGAGEGRRLLTVFHELWASGPPWKREFYTSFLQRRIAMRLHRFSDHAVTSVALMKAALDKIHPGKTTLLPIPSPFPETSAYSTGRDAAGPLQVIAFGQEPSRALSIAAHEQLIRSLYERGMLKCVAVAGKDANNDTNPSQDVELLRRLVPAEMIRAFPNVTPADGAQLLQSADLFLSYYPSAYLCKSSALMAALSNGCVPVLPEVRNAAPLRDRVEVVACGPRTSEATELLDWISAGGLGAASESGWAWYQANASWPTVAGVFADLIHSLDAQRSNDAA